MQKIEFKFELIDVVKFAIIWGLIFTIIMGLGAISLGVLSAILFPFTSIACSLYLLKFILDRITIVNQ